MIQGFDHLQKYFNDILNLVHPLVWEKINFLADVRKDTTYIIDVSTAWKAQKKTKELTFLKTNLASCTLLLSSTTLLFFLLVVRFTNASCTVKQSTRK